MPPKRGRGRGTRGRGGGPDRSEAVGRPGQSESGRGFGRQSDSAEAYESRPSRPPAEVYRPPARRGRPAEQAEDAGRRQEPQIQEFAPPRQVQAPPKLQPARQEKPSKLEPEVLQSVAGLSLEHEPLQVKKHEMARRQPKGTLGRPIDLYANYFLLKFKDINIFHYDVDIVFIRQFRKTEEGAEAKDAAAAAKKFSKGQSILKEGRTAKEDAEKKVSHVEHQQKRAPGKQRCRQIITEMTRDPRLTSYNPVYDGVKNLYTTKKLPMDDKKDSRKFPINLDEEGSIKQFEVTVKPVIKADGSNLISLEPLFELYRGRSKDVPHEVVMAFDTVMCHRSPPFSQVQVGRSFFPLDGMRHHLGEGMEIWFGYNQSVHLTQRGLAVIVNFAAKAFHQEGSVIDCACDILNEDITKLPKLFPNQIKILGEALSKVKVEVTHLRYPRKYPVKGLTKTSAKDTRFKLEDGSEKSVADYFRETYRPLRYPNLPCLHMRTNKNTTFIPMEHCRIFGGQPKLGKLSGKMTSDMIRKTAITPAERFDKIWGNVNLIEQVSGKLMSEFGLFMELKFMELQGRVIGPPKLAYRPDERGPSLANVNEKGTWKMDGMQFFRSKSEICSWMLLSFAGDRFCGIDKLHNFARTLCHTARNLGINLEEPNDIKIFGRNVRTRVALEHAKRQNVTFAVVVLSSRDQAHSYEEVKFIADIQLHLITQCMDELVVVKKFNPQVATNVLLKINSKLGGVNHTLSQKPVILTRPVIILGADAAHSPRGYACPSIAAVVGSLDAFPSRYAVTCRVQYNPDEKKLSQEIIVELRDMVREILRAFLANTRGKKPEKIIFFRDGVSEGQFQTVLENEINMVQYACADVLDGFVPPLTFIIVQKRHQTRFRPRNPRDGVGRPGNVPPGTTVDTDVVHPVFFDFFLCSHEGIQGTSKPAHYTVLFDENKMSSDELQKLCYHLCHMYVRCNRSISVPAPVMYAHLACARAKKYADLHLRDDAASMVSGSSGETRPLPPDVVEAITGMGNFEPGMFYV